MNRLLAKLPRSSSGSRDASANSSASRLPFDILDVSITDAGACFCGFALVSSLICFSGASNDDFISFCHSERSRGISYCFSTGNIERRLDPFDLRSGQAFARHDKLVASRAISWLVEFCPLAGVLLQNVARHKLLVALRQRIHLFDNLLQTKMLGETQRSAAMRRESGSENHSVIRVLGRFYHFFFNATRRLVDH